MQCSDTIDRMAANNAKIRHANHSVITLFDDRHATKPSNITRPPLLDLSQQMQVDIIDDLQMATTTMPIPSVITETATETECVCVCA
jgi:hypothetical protein